MMIGSALVSARRTAAQLDAGKAGSIQSSTARSGAFAKPRSASSPRAMVSTS